MRKSKYNNRIAYAGGRRFDSVKEMQRWAFLQGEEREGRIRDLRCQVRYELTPVKACYVADFVYLMPDGVEVIEDVKGMRTEVYRLKKEMMAALLGLQVREVYAPGEPLGPASVFPKKRKRR